MIFYKSPQTKSKCYQKATPIKPVGVLWHSTGKNNKYLRRYVDDEANLGKNQYGNHWNRPNATKAVHAFIGLDKNECVAVVQTLPYDIAAWGVGSGKNGSYNYNPHAYIQFEICEDNLSDKAYFDACLEAAVEYTVSLCKQFGWTEKNVTSHVEAARAGYASNHGDPEHWLKKHGMSMDTVRARVKAALTPVPAPTPKPQEIKVGDIVTFAGTRHYSNSNGLLTIGKLTTPGKAMVTSIATGKRRPYHLRAVNDKGQFVSGVNGWVYAVDVLLTVPVRPFKAYTARVNTTAGLNVRSGAGSNYTKVGALKNGTLFTVYEENTGRGARLWGRIGSGRWIALDYTQKI